MGFRAFVATVVALIIALLAANLAMTQTPVVAGGVRVMTYNIHHGSGNDDCTDEETPEGEIPDADCALDLERIAEVIQSQSPDIVALQEVDRLWARSGGVDQSEALAGMLGMNVCYGANLTHDADDHADEPHEYGVAVLSVFPIESCENTELPTTEGWEQRGLLDARVQLPAIGEVAVLNTHFQSNASGEETEAGRQRTEQATAVSEYVAGLTAPVILMGDFNAEPGDEELQSLTGSASVLIDGWIAGGTGGEGLTRPSHPDEEPVERIDLILFTEPFIVSGVEVVDDDTTRMASDHFPVVADLAIEASVSPSASPVV